MRALSKASLATAGMALAGALALLLPPRAGLAFDNEQFCVAAKELVRASAIDVGTWTDRFTRNDGVEIGCDLKTVHFKRFYKSPAKTLTDAWRDNQAVLWQSAYCHNSLWQDAIANGWVVSATVTTSTGERVWLACLPDGRGFYRMLP
jgi:hypothetical protein